MESATISTRERIGRHPDADPTASALSRIGWAPADPAPLGLAGFAMTTFVLSMFNAQLVGSGGEPVVLGLALAYGGLAPLLAGVWEFRPGNTVGAVALTSFGAFWLSFAVLVAVFEPSIPSANLDASIGLYLWAWAIFTSYMFVASLRTTGAVALVFLLLATTFILLAAGNSGGNTDVIKWGGYLGLATAAAAWYASFAVVVNSTFKRTVMPVVPLARK